MLSKLGVGGGSVGGGGGGGERGSSPLGTCTSAPVTGEGSLSAIGGGPTRPASWYSPGGGGGRDGQSSPSGGGGGGGQYSSFGEGGGGGGSGGRDGGTGGQYSPASTGQYDYSTSDPSAASSHQRNTAGSGGDPSAGGGGGGGHMLLASPSSRLKHSSSGFAAGGGGGLTAPPPSQRSSLSSPAGPPGMVPRQPSILRRQVRVMGTGDSGGEVTASLPTRPLIIDEWRLWTALRCIMDPLSPLPSTPLPTAGPRPSAFRRGVILGGRGWGRHQHPLEPPGGQQPGSHAPLPPRPRQ